MSDAVNLNEHPITISARSGNGRGVHERFNINSSFLIEIQAFIERGAAASNNGQTDVAIVEIGGTVGDIESLPFLEAVRQMSLRLGRGNSAFVHLTLVPWIAGAGELKTKPTQHSVQKLREIGIMPNALLCRADRMIPEDEKSKISLFANFPVEAVVSVCDVATIYKVPRLLLS